MAKFLCYLCSNFENQDRTIVDSEVLELKSDAGVSPVFFFTAE